MKQPLLSSELAQAILAARQRTWQAAAAWINRHNPALRAEILAAADQALEGRIPIDGSLGKPFDVGNPPAWKEIRTPDNHYGSTLNRMPHWAGLLKAFWLTGDLRYARKAADEAESWIDACPRPPLPRNQAERFGFYGVSADQVPWHCLNSGLRLFDSWRRLVESLAGTEALPPALLDRIARSMREQAEAIRAVSPFLFPEAKHNHYLMEMLGVLSYARLFPDMPESADWARHAVGELGRCALAQLEPEGAQVEGCPSYHNGCMAWFILARRLAADCGLSLGEEVDRRIQKGIRHAVYATRPFGEEVPWGDSHPRQGFVTSALLGGIAFDDWAPLDQIRLFTDAESVQRVCLESIWDVPDWESVVTRLEKAPVPAAPSWPLIDWQKGVKQVSLRTGWDPQALGLFFACHSPVHYGNHPHADPNGFEFSAGGRVLLEDPGCCSYFENETRRRIKSAACHNMLTVNFREPFDYCSSFAYSPQKEGRIDWIQEAPGLLAAQGSHRNYEPAIHRRAVALVENRFLLVLDEVTDLFWLSSVQLYYQLPFERVLSGSSGTVTAWDAGQAHVALAASASLTAQPPRWVEPDPAAGLEHGFTTVRFDDFSQSHEAVRCYATLVVPLQGKETPAPLMRPVLEVTPEGWRFRLEVMGRVWQGEWRPDGISIRMRRDRSI